LNEIIREIDADIKSEKLAALMKRYGNLAVSLAALTVLLVAANSAYNSYQKNTSEKNGDSYAAAQKLVAEGKTEEAKNSMLALSSEKSGYGIIANSTLIKNDFDGNKIEDAKSKLIAARKTSKAEISTVIDSSLALAGNISQNPRTIVELEAAATKLISEAKLLEAYKLIEANKSISDDEKIKSIKQYILARTSIEGDKKDASGKN